MKQEEISILLQEKWRQTPDRSPTSAGPTIHLDKVPQLRLPNQTHAAPRGRSTTPTLKFWLGAQGCYAREERCRSPGVQPNYACFFILKASEVSAQLNYPMARIRHCEQMRHLSRNQEDFTFWKEWRELVNYQDWKAGS